MGKTLKFGGGVWATKKGSTLAHNDEDGNFKPLPFTYTGAGKGTRVNKEGLIEVVENDRPRIDYLDSEDGVFLLEKAATNLFTYSDNFGIGTYSSSLITYSSNTLDVLSPKGDNSSDKFTVTTSGGDAHRRITKSISVQNFTASIYVKGEVGQKFHLFVARDGYAELKDGYFTCNGEWQRFSFSDTFTTTSTSVVIGLEFGWGSDDSVANDIYYLWGMQLESGNLSSYIPTQGTIQTRVQETASGSGNSEVFNSEQGVLYANISALSNDGSDRVITISNGSTNNRITFYYSVANGLNYNVLNNGVVQAFGTVTVNDITEIKKIAIKYKVNDFSFFVDGFKLLTETSGTVPNGLDRLNFDNGSGGFDFYGKTKEIAYYDEVLTDLELETLTSYRTWEEMVKELNLNIIHNE